MKIPAQLMAGDSVTWKDCPTFDNLRRQLAPPDWTLKYSIRGSSGLDLTATQDGPDWSTTISTAQSAAFTPGDFYWSAFVENGSERITIGQGKLVVLANLSAQPTNAVQDNRSQTKKDLDAVQAAMRALISGGAIQRYVIANRQIDKMTFTDLRAMESVLLARWKREEKAEMIANGLGNPNMTFVRF